MIKASELRIGNWVYSPEDENVMIESVEKDWCNVRTNGDGEFHESYGCPTQNLDPIPLTQDILVKCGFILKPNEKLFDCYTTEVDGTDYLFFYYEEKKELHAVGIVTYDLHCKEDGVANFAWHIKYLHQLQNLYYALTNEELNIQL